MQGYRLLKGLKEMKKLLLITFALFYGQRLLACDYLLKEIIGKWQGERFPKDVLEFHPDFTCKVYTEAEDSNEGKIAEENISGEWSIGQGRACDVIVTKPDHTSEIFIVTIFEYPDGHTSQRKSAWAFGGSSLNSVTLGFTDGLSHRGLVYSVGFSCK